MTRLAQYKNLTDDDISAFKNICRSGQVLTGEEIGVDFGHDELSSIRRMPEALILPANREEVSQILAYANQHCVPVTPRGQGTGLVGGAVPVQGGVLLDLSGMNRILSLDEENLTLTLEPGVLLMDVIEYVETRGFYYPPNPGEKSATIGGNVSTNAGGMSAVKYGVTRDYVLGLEVVLADGRIVQLGGAVAKNSSGYALKDLIVGSEGTLGVVTRITLRLLPLPPFSISLLVPFPDLPTAIDAVPDIIKSKAVPRSLEFMERDVILAAEEYLGKRFPDNSSDAYLLLTFDGSARDEIEREFQQAAGLCLEKGALDVLIADTQERQEAIWTPRGAFLEAIKASTTEMDECDVVVPRNRIADFIRFSLEVQAQEQIRIKSFGHAGDGNLHIYILRDRLSQADWDARLERVFSRLYDYAARLGGKVSGEHGIGYAKKAYLEQHEDAAVLELMHGLKKVFDPNGILNPGKILN